MKILIVGAGFSGAVFGRLAAEADHDVTIIDKRNHIGGNCYSYCDEQTDIEVHKYGPHIFHTNNKRTWDFVNRFISFNNFINRVKAQSNNSIYSMPVNLGTINQFFNKTLSPTEAKKFIDDIRVHKNKVENFEDFIISSLGIDLYEAFYKYYTIKQWGVPPQNIPSTTAKRLPIRFNYNDNYFSDRYQGVPIGGYTALFKRMIDHKKIKIKLGSDFEEYRTIWRQKFKYLVYTGSLDEYFEYDYGELPYRSVRFEEIRDKEIQGNAVINYTDNSVKFTRIHEHKWFTPEKSFNSSIGFKEYAFATTSKKSPYYPVRNGQSNKLYEKYINRLKTEKDVIFIGRLAEFKYFDMHHVIASSMSKFRKWVLDN